LQKIAGITSAVKSTIQIVKKKPQRVNHAVMKIRITRTVNNDSQNIYTLRVG